MIEVDLVGGLGNWLFQYAAGRALALKHRTRLLLNLGETLSPRDPLGLRAVRALSFFRIEAGFTRVSGLPRRLLERLRLREDRNAFNESGWGADPRFAGLDARTRLRGYFQSPSYWQGVEPVLRAELSPRALPAHPPFHDALAAIDGANAVSVHVRRGDYLDSALHRVCTPAYYAGAIDRMRESVPQPRFFVFSDDLAWCRAHLTGADIAYVDLGPRTRNAPLELTLMSRCRHHILSNSTFSWWGAWLDGRADAIVYVPDRWFNDAALDRLAMRHTVPPAWRRLPADPQALALK